MEFAVNSINFGEIAFSPRANSSRRTSRLWCSSRGQISSSVRSMLASLVWQLMCTFSWFIVTMRLITSRRMTTVDRLSDR
jgi:hypothetical protein